jgi:adenylate kinase family enzyme
MKLAVYTIMLASLFLTGCDDHGQNLCDAYPAVRQEIQAKEREFSSKGGRSPASIDDSIAWSEGLMKRVQWARDHFEADREKDVAHHFLTEASDQTIYLVGYIQQGKRSGCVRTLRQIDERLEQAFKVGCSKKGNSKEGSSKE